MNESRPKPLHIVLGIAGIIIAAVLYTVLGSKIGNPPAEAYTPEAYGVEKLEAEAPPAMQIAVWQRNEKNPLHFERNHYDKTFYNMVDLPLEEGASVCTITDNSYLDNHPHNVATSIQIYFEGLISGQYELKYSSALDFSGDNDIMPFNSPDSFNTPDTYFDWYDLVTVSVHDLSSYVYHAEEYRRNNGTKTYEEYIKSFEQAGNFDLDDYLTYEKITDVYTDVPEELQDLYRAVVTTHLYIYGNDPVKQDIVLAEAVLELKSHSHWIGLGAGQPEYLFEQYGFENKSYTDVTVVSYTQSDSYALE